MGWLERYKKMEALFAEQPPLIQEWLRREEFTDFLGLVRDPKIDHKEIREYRQTHGRSDSYHPYIDHYAICFLTPEVVKRAHQSIKQAEFLDINAVAGQFPPLFAERGYGFDVLPATFPDLGSAANSDEIFSRLFGPVETDSRYLFPYLAVMARYEWKHMDPRMRNIVSAKGKNSFESGRLPALMITRVVDREMGLPRQRLAIKARARIYWQVFEKTRTHIVYEQIGKETPNEAFMRARAAEIADFETANSIASHALDAWSSLNDDERLVFGEDFDIIERGLPESFFVTMLHLKDKLAKMETRYVVAHVRAMLNDFAKLTGEQIREMRIQMSPRTGKPQISIGYILDWYDENDDHDDIDGAGSAGGAAQGPASLPPAEGSKGGTMAAGLVSSVNGLLRFLGLHDNEDTIIDRFVSSGDTHRSIQTQQAGMPSFPGMQSVNNMMIAGAAAMRPVPMPFATPLIFMPMPLQFRPAM